MTVGQAIERLKYDRDMCFFDPTTGRDDHPVSEDCAEMAEAIEIAIKEIENQNAILTKILEEINTPNRGTCDYFIVDRIEEIIKKRWRGGMTVNIYEILNDGEANEIMLGYMIIAAENAGMNRDQIRQLRNGMRLALSEKTAREAERYYQQTGDRS